MDEENPVKIPTALLRHQVGWTAIGVLGGFFRNYTMRRPYFASIHVHAVLGVAGYLFGTQAGKYIDRKNKINEMVIQDYIRLHPEDFVEPPRRMIKDMLNKWEPVR